jgi:hypothetical protein
MRFQARADALRLRRVLVDVRKLCAALGVSRGAKQQARGLLVLCPWHAEKYASCSVTLGQDGTVRVHCFTCQFSGDALTLIARVRELDVKTQFRDVLAEVASIAGSEPPQRRALALEPQRTLGAASYAAVAIRLLELCSLEKERDALRYLERRKLLVAAWQARVSALPAPEKQGAIIQALLRDFDPMRPMGSYKDWSRVVRAALVWAGQPDVAVTQDDLRDSANEDRTDASILLRAWYAYVVKRRRRWPTWSTSSREPNSGSTPEKRRSSSLCAPFAPRQRGSFQPAGSSDTGSGC